MKKKWMLLLTVPMILAACNKADDETTTTTKQTNTETVRKVTTTDNKTKDLHLENFEGRWMDTGMIKKDPTLIDHVIIEFTAKGKNKAEIEVNSSLVKGKDTSFTKTVTFDENKKATASFEGGTMAIVLNESGDDRSITLTLANEEGSEVVKAGDYEMVPYEEQALVTPESNTPEQSDQDVIANGEEKIKMELSQMGEEGYEIYYNDFVQKDGKKQYHYSLMLNGKEDATKYAFYEPVAGTVTFEQ